MGPFPTYTIPTSPAKVREAVAKHYERRAARLDAIGRGAASWYHREWAFKVREGRNNPLVRRAFRIARVEG